MSAPAIAIAADRCKMCGSTGVRNAGTVEYFKGFPRPIYDCSNCRSRFSDHENFMPELLHSDKRSPYNLYRELSDACTDAFARGDLNGLKAYLSQTSKFKFVIDKIESGPRNAKLLEIGCSRGYLTSYFILAGYSITGVDVSPTAIQSATDVFGDHFVLSGDASIAQNAPYDVIYHVGTIGCVSDPVAMTNGLTRLLKPGGKLLFNSPNVQGCWLDGQLWVDSAPPPDVVSLFSPGFWTRHFADVADVQETIEFLSPARSLAINLQKTFGRRWQKPSPIGLTETAAFYGGHANFGTTPAGAAWKTFERVTVKLFRVLKLSEFVSKQPSEFGLFVEMTRR